jgi:very-short-patch-repair endonuclease
MLEYLDAVAVACRRRDLEKEWSRRSVANALRSRAATVMLPQQVVLRSHARDPSVRARAITQWNRHAAVTGALALHLGRPGLPAPQVADVVIERPHTLAAPAWIRVRSTSSMPPNRVINHVRIVGLEFALLDAWRQSAPSDRKNVFYEAMWQRASTAAKLRVALAQTPRLPARRQLELLITYFEDGMTSPLEVVAHREVFTGAVFSDFERQVEMRVAGRRRTVDMLHRQAMLVVELDGDGFHGGIDAQRADRERNTDFASAGYLTLRFGWRDLRERPTWCREQVLKVLRTRLHAAA